MAAEQPPPRDRTVRNLVLLLVGGALIFAVIAAAVTTVRTERLLQKTFAGGHSCCGPLDLERGHTLSGCDAPTVIQNLGGRERALLRLRFHLALPGFVVSREARISALSLLGYCGDEAGPLVEGFSQDADDVTKMTANDALKRIKLGTAREAPQ